MIYMWFLNLNICNWTPMRREIYQRFRASQHEEPDIHTKLMRKYDDIPAWWFYSLTVLSMAVSLILCTVLNDQVQIGRAHV